MPVLSNRDLLLCIQAITVAERTAGDRDRRKYERLLEKVSSREYEATEVVLTHEEFRRISPHIKNCTVVSASGRRVYLEVDAQTYLNIKRTLSPETT